MNVPETIQFQTPDNVREGSSEYFVGSDDGMANPIVVHTIVNTRGGEAYSTEFNLRKIVDKSSPTPDPTQTLKKWLAKENVTDVSERYSGAFLTTIPTVEVIPPLGPEDRQKAAAVIGASMMATIHDPFARSNVGADLIAAGIPFEDVRVQTTTRNMSY